MKAARAPRYRLARMHGTRRYCRAKSITRHPRRLQRGHLNSDLSNGASARGYQEVSATSAIRTTAEQAGGQTVCLCIASAGRECALLAPFYEGFCQGHGPGAVEGAAALVGVNVVRPAGR